MANSRNFKKLLSRINFLKEKILPEEKVNGNYTKAEQDLIKSFVLLSHAEIEFFLENLARDKVQYCFEKWKNTRKGSNCLISIISFCSHSINFSKDKDSANLEHRMHRTVDFYLKSVLDANHGVKEKNILDILLPLGVELKQIDQTWLQTMNSYGNTRGKFAHEHIGPQEQIDRKTQLNILFKQVLPEMEQIDLIIKKIK